MNNEEKTLQIIAPVLQTELISPKLSETILQNFQQFFEEIGRYEEEAKSLEVIDENEVDKMKRARELRLTISKIRIEAEKKRKFLKEDYLRGGRAIQGVYNIIESLTIPIEKHLEQQEKFKELLEQKRKLEITEKRLNLLSEFVDDTSVYNLAEMSEAGFQELLNASKIAREQKLKAEKDAEDERIRIQKEIDAENERIRIENEKLKADAKKREKELEDERKKQAEILKKEQEAKAKIEAELEEKRKADEKLKQEQAEKEAKELANKKALELAPDKEKLNKLAEQIANIELPKLQNEQSNLIINQVKELLSKVSIYIIKNTKNL